MNQIEEQQLNKRIEIDPKWVRCECSSVILFEPSKPEYKTKDEQGNLISAKSAEHMAQHRVRCSNCAKNFCTSCKREPYHVGMTCEEAENN